MVLVILAAIALGWILWFLQPQPLLPEATAALSSTPAVVFDQSSDGRLTYAPAGGTPTSGLILYPGAKVPPAAYARAAQAIAAAGHLVVIVPVPFNLAILGVDAAAAVVADHPEIETWAVGGHSLGGAMAAQFAASNPGLIDGLVLWAAYSPTDLSDQGLIVASSYGSLDRGAPSFSDPGNVARLGSAVTTDVIEGGNHEQMGWYTGQPNDPPATLPRVDQQARIVADAIALLGALRETPQE